MFNLKSVFSLLFLGLFLFSFASAGDLNDSNDLNYSDLNFDLLMCPTTSQSISDTNVTFSICYSINYGDTNNYLDYNVSYDINGNVFYNLEVEDLNSGASYYNNSYVWDITSYGHLDVNVCLNHPDDFNFNNNCVSFDLNIYEPIIIEDLNTDLNAYSLVLNDADLEINYGSTLKIDFNFNNVGAYDLNEDFNVVFKAGDIDINTQTFSNLQKDDFNFATYTWTSNKTGNVDIEVCLVYATDLNQENNCLEETINVKSVDLEAVKLVLSSTSVNSGVELTATLTYENVGTLDLTDKYTIKFYRDSSSISDCEFKDLTTDVDMGSQKTKACVFTAPSVTSTKEYDIKATITYSKDSDTSNNTVTKELTVKKTTEATSGAGSDSDSDIDFKVISLNLSKSEITLNEKLEITFIFKNVGTLKATSNYNVFINAKLDSKTETICSKNYTEDLAKNTSKEYVCTWTPSKLGEYTIIADVDYPDESTYNNNTISKKIKVLNKVITITGKTEKEVLLEDLNDFVKENNLNFSSNALSYLEDITIKRDFNVIKNDDNTFTTHVKLTLNTDKNFLLENYFYYEYLPDENKFLEFELDLNGSSTLEYDLNYDVSKDLQAKFYGALFSKDVLSAPKQIYNSDKGSVLYYIAMVVLGLIIIALIVWLVLKIIKNREPKFNPYKKHKKVVRVEEKHTWQGFGVDDAPKVKYKGGKYKHKEPEKVSGYKGWK
jgi:hypothetical protein